MEYSMDISDIAEIMAHLPNQIHRRNVIKGFNFNMMVVGDSGLGKSTFINMLFKSDIYQEVSYDEFDHRYSQEPEFHSSTATLVENGVTLRLETIELLPHGWASDNQDCWDKVLSYIQNRLESSLINQTSIAGPSQIKDPKIHCCIYFIPPHAHFLRPHEINFMKKVCTSVNLIPLIAKADTLTTEESLHLKNRIRRDLEENNICVYDFPDLKRMETYKPSISHIKTHEKSSHYQDMPFAIVASRPNGSGKYTRNYSWGEVDADDPKHSDFTKFRDLFIRTHMHHLILYTKKCIFERYRRVKLLCDSGTLTTLDNLDDHEAATSNNQFEENGLMEEENASDPLNRLANMLESQYLSQANHFEQLLAKREKELKGQLERRVEASQVADSCSITGNSNNGGFMKKKKSKLALALQGMPQSPEKSNSTNLDKTKKKKKDKNGK